MINLSNTFLLISIYKAPTATIGLVFQLSWYHQLYFNFIPTVIPALGIVGNFIPMRDKLDPFVRIILSHQHHLPGLDVVPCLQSIQVYSTGKVRSIPFIGV